MPPRWVALAEVSRPHGVRGEVRLKVYNPDSDVLLGQTFVVLRAVSGDERRARVESIRRANDAFLLKLDGIDDRDRAEPLRGAEVRVPREVLPPPEPGEFYVCDVVGARLVDAGGTELDAVVEDLTSYPTVDVLVVRAAHGRRVEIALVDTLVERVEVDQGIVRVRPEALGLLA